jgi:hypothetical protein
MGYDNRFHLVQKYNYGIAEEIDGKHYFPAQVIATYEACGLNWEAEDAFRAEDKETNITFLDNVFKGCDEAGNEIYACEYVTKDAYDRPLTEFTIQEAIKILREAERKEHYRRNTILLGMLLAIDEDEWDTIRLLHYGH